MTAVLTPQWTVLCRLSELVPERGVAALMGRTQVAVFRTHDNRVYATGNLDPFSGAHVLSRGIVGSRDTVPTVASPMYKQVFDLRTGQCLDDPTVSVPVYPVRLVGGLVEVGGP